jgi:hypothetical protein
MDGLKNDLITKNEKLIDKLTLNIKNIEGKLTFLEYSTKWLNTAVPRSELSSWSLNLSEDEDIKPLPDNLKCRQPWSLNRRRDPELYLSPNVNAKSRGASSENSGVFSGQTKPILDSSAIFYTETERNTSRQRFRERISAKSTCSGTTTPRKGQISERLFSSRLESSGFNWKSGKRFVPERKRNEAKGVVVREPDEVEAEVRHRRLRDSARRRGSVSDSDTEKKSVVNTRERSSSARKPEKEKKFTTKTEVNEKFSRRYGTSSVRRRNAGKGKVESTEKRSGESLGTVVVKSDEEVGLFDGDAEFKQFCESVPPSKSLSEV